MSAKRDFRSRALRDAPVEVRFWQKVVKTDGCWLWRGALRKNGYGAAWDGEKVVQAHRLSLEWHIGRSLLDGEWALHHCDVRNCVRPDHLFVGDRAANIADMVAKNRQGRGDMKATRLSSDAVRDMRARFAAGESLNSIAERYGVRHSYAWRVVHRAIWKCVDQEAA